MRANNQISGIIDTEQGPVTFLCNNIDFCFNFMNPIPFNEKGERQCSRVRTENNFIFGKTYANHEIAIYFPEKELDVFTHQPVYSSAFFVSHQDIRDDTIREFDGIRFIGKSLNKVFEKKGLVVKYEEDGDKFIHNDDGIIYDITTKDFTFRFTVRSIVNYQGGTEGNGLSNNKVICELEFEQKQPLNEFFLHFNNMRNIISFLTNRLDVGFEEIYLLKNNERIHFRTELAKVYIVDKSEITKRDDYNILSFNDLGDSLPELIGLFYNPKERKPHCSLGFYPKNDGDIYLMTSDKIRAICSGLECELAFAKDIQTENNQYLNNLTAQTKELIKSFRNENPDTISDNTYSMIFSSLSHWSNSLAERIFCLYKKFFVEINILNREIGVRLGEEEIKAFVKYRNDITHGNHRVLDRRIAYTAHLLSGLVYCSLLDRIGVSREKICELCEHKLLR